MEDKVMVVRYDGKPAKDETWKGKRIPWFIDTEGFSVMVTCREHAEQRITRRPDRFRLYRSLPWKANIINTNGARVWVDIENWYYRKESFSTGLDKNGETAYQYRYAWLKDEKGEHIVPATEEFIIGRKKTADDIDRISLIQKEKEALESLNKSYLKQLVELRAEIGKIQQQIADLQPKRGRPPVVKP